MKILTEGLDFDDVLLVPQYSNVTTRAKVRLNGKVSSSLELALPILSASMSTVTEVDMALAVASAGGLGVLHRYNTPQVQAEMVKAVRGASRPVSAAIGVKPEDIGRAGMLVDQGVNLLVVDVAHADSKLTLDFVSELRRQSDVSIMVGNIATAHAARRLIDVGATALKVGIGNGSMCTTRKATGSGVPQLTAIMDVVKVADQFDVYVCADGGMYTSGDIVKALAAGADTVMVGSLLAGTDEAPGEFYHGRDGVKRKRYAGMASEYAKEAAGLPTEHIEGVSGMIESKGSVVDVLESLAQGMRSGFSYCGSYSLGELHAKAVFIKKG